MSDKKIDYDALARSARADTSAVDYDALAAQARQPNSPTTFRTPTQGQLARKPLEMALGALPLAGGIAGGIIGGGAGLAAGGPWGAYGGEVLGSGMGGAAGKAASQAIGSLMGIPIPESYLGDIAKAGIGQSVAGAAGGAISRGAGAVAKPLMKSAIRATASTADAFPTVAPEKVALYAGIPVGAFKGVPGSVRAGINRANAAQDLQIILKAHRGTFAASDFAKEALEQAKNSRERPLSLQETRVIMQQVKNRLNEILSDRAFGVGYNPNQHTYTARELKAIKQSAQDAVREQFRAIPRGRTPNADPKLDMSIAKAAERIMADKIPAAAAKDKEVQAYMALTRALKAAEHRHVGLTIPMIAGAGATMLPDGAGGQLVHGLGALGLARMAESPMLQSRAALGLNNKAFQEVLKQLPKGLLGAFQATSPDATQP